MRNVAYTKFYPKSLKRRDFDFGTHRIRWKTIVVCWYGLDMSGQGPVAGSYKHGNKILYSKKGVEFLDQQRLSASQHGLCSVH
jgi:hypothetical protein